ncbi:MAG: hypothetical protein K0Q73_8365 [Paenibacillus sp.]|jgi:hypothetical protein|nr:hypothetical protein [Paenibacillus sp.]
MFIRKYNLTNKKMIYLKLLTTAPIPSDVVIGKLLMVVTKGLFDKLNIQFEFFGVFISGFLE